MKNFIKANLFKIKKNNLCFSCHDYAVTHKDETGTISKPGNFVGPKTSSEVTNVGVEPNLTCFKPSYKFFKCLTLAGGLFVCIYIS